MLRKKREHAAEAGALPDDEPEVCVVEGGAVLPDSLSTNVPSAAKPAALAAASACAAAAAASSSVAAAAASSFVAAAVLGASVKECSAHAGVLHAHHGATVEAAAAAAAAGSSYAPLFFPSTALLEDVLRFFGLEGRDGERGSFPRERLVVRSPTARSLLLLADEVVALLAADGAGSLRVVNTGVRLLEREEAKGAECSHRAVQDGLEHLLPHLTKQTADVSPACLHVLLQAKQLSAEEMCAHADLKPLHAALQASCRAGSVVLVCTPPGQPPLGIAALLAPSGSLCPMVKGPERQAITFRIGTADLPLPASAEEAGEQGNAEAADVSAPELS